MNRKMNCLRPGLYEFITALFLLSLSGCYWSQKIDYKSYMDKRSYKDFSELDTPVIIKKEFDLVFEHNEEDSRDIESGSINYIYDWKNNELFDWFYTPQNVSCDGFLPYIKTETGALRYYSINSHGSKLVYFDSTKTTPTEIKVSLPSIVDGAFYRWEQNQNPDNRFLVCTARDKYKTGWVIIVIDTLNNKIYNTYEFKNEFGPQYTDETGFFGVQDSCGYFWYITEEAIENQPDNYSLYKINLEAKGKPEFVKNWEAPVLSSGDHQIQYADNKFLYLGHKNKNGEISFNLMDKETLEETNLSFPVENREVYKYSIIVGKNEIYLLVLGTKHYLYKFDKETMTLNTGVELSDSWFTNGVSRGDNIILRRSYTYKREGVFSVNKETGDFLDEILLDQDDIVK